MTREEIASYYDRRPGVNGEFATPEDKANEAEVAERIARRWDLQLNDWGDWAPLDRWAERDERPTGVLEIKCRPILSTKYPCAWLNWRKYLWMRDAERELGVPAFYFVRFDDVTLYIRQAEVEARMNAIGGTSRYVHSPTDREPVIFIPRGEMRVLP